MPLFINGLQVQRTPTVDSFIDEYPHFKESSQYLLKQEVRVVGPQQLLYVGQREVAGTFPLDESVSVLGSEDATTCHIAVLRHTSSGATSLIHFDGCSTTEGLKTMISIVTELTENMSSGRLEFHLVGGFDDKRRNSHEVSDKVFIALCECADDIHLVTACITHHNTVYKQDSMPFPIIYGLAVDVKTGLLYRATFPDKGPDLPLRSARHFTGGKENIVIYDHWKRELVIGPFDYETMPDVDIYLTLPNSIIRKYLSTSPEQEPEDFEDSVRASLVQLRDFPQPLVSIFKDGQPRRYKKDNTSGAWVLVNKGSNIRI
uniref:Protein N-terminal asparagine amidohydrolase n=2 Tax=Arion vulgaris TaxID=1028688 RepID=A0A0B6ZH03_9EUPU